MTVKTILEFKPKVEGVPPELNIPATLCRIDRALIWCAEQIQKLALATPIQTMAVTNKVRSFICKVDGFIKEYTIDLGSPVCPICQGNLPAYTMSQANPEKGYASVPVYRCENDRLYFNWSRNNKEGWQ